MSVTGRAAPVLPRYRGHGAPRRPGPGIDRRRSGPDVGRASDARHARVSVCQRAVPDRRRACRGVAVPVAVLGAVVPVAVLAAVVSTAVRVGLRDAVNGHRSPGWVAVFGPLGARAAPAAGTAGPCALPLEPVGEAAPHQRECANIRPRSIRPRADEAARTQPFLGRTGKNEQAPRAPGSHAHLHPEVTQAVPGTPGAGLAHRPTVQPPCCTRELGASVMSPSGVVTPGKAFQAAGTHTFNIGNVSGSFGNRRPIAKGGRQTPGPRGASAPPCGQGRRNPGRPCRSQPPTPAGPLGPQARTGHEHLQLRKRRRPGQLR